MAKRGKRIGLRDVAALGPGGLIWDGALPGFGARRQSGEAVNYVLKYRAPDGRQRWATLGRHGAPWTPETARAEARRLLAGVAAGVDPAAERMAAKVAPRLAELAERFLAEHAATKLKPSTTREYRRLCASVLLPALGAKRVAALTRQDVAALHHAKRATPTEANRAVACLSAMLTQAERWGIRPDGSNPCRHVERYRQRARERFLSAAELARLGDALAGWQGNPTVTAAIRLLLFTGARLGEVLGLRWTEIDAERGVARLPDSKTGAKTLHLPPPALAVLAELPRIDPHVLGAARGKTFIEGPWRKLRVVAGLADVRLHDLRHAFASVAASSGLGLPIIGKMLGHTQAATMQRYAHLASDPVGAAAASVAARIAAALGGGQGSGEVVALRPARGR